MNWFSRCFLEKKAGARLEIRQLSKKNRFGKGGIMFDRLMSAAVLLCFITFGSGAGAAPVAYNFLTGGNPFTATGPVFGSGDFVSGSFLYDQSAAASPTPPGGPTQYNRSMLNLAGSVAGFAFSDPFGFILVGNNLGPSLVDSLGMNADSTGTGTRNIVPFTVGEYTLVNVRLFWGQSGVTEFLTDQSLPAHLPVIQGRMALDFSKTGTAFSYDNSVFFDGLHVAAIPEPASGALMLTGLGLLAFAARRRKLKRTAAAWIE